MTEIKKNQPDKKNTKTKNDSEMVKETEIQISKLDYIKKINNDEEHKVFQYILSDFDP